MDPKDARRREAAEMEADPVSVAEGKPITGPLYPSYRRDSMDGMESVIGYSPDPRIAVAAKLFPVLLPVYPTPKLAVVVAVELADQLVRAVAQLPPLPVPSLLKTD